MDIADKYCYFSISYMNTGIFVFGKKDLVKLVKF